MPDPVVTLTTDFGRDSPYVGAVKGVILAINRLARLVDLSHEIPPQDLRYTSFFLRACLPFFSRETLHLIVVDPGVGTDRALLLVELECGKLLVPDNGCWTELASSTPAPPHVIQLTEPRYRRPTVSATFHGRDILAPAAGHLSQGLAADALGPPADSWVSLDLPHPRREPWGWVGEVVFVDHFGNLITNILAQDLAAHRECCFEIGTRSLSRVVRTYGEVPAGTAVALISSFGMLEIAVNQGNAAAQFQAGVGTPVIMRTARADVAGG
jgi:S-adenosylmethionine hydrolase